MRLRHDAPIFVPRPASPGQKPADRKPPISPEMVVHVFRQRIEARAVIIKASGSNSSGLFTVKRKKQGPLRTPVPVV